MKEALLVILVLFMSGMSMSQGKTVKLWRTSSFDQTVKIHIATFDNAKENVEFNWLNCIEVAALFTAANTDLGVKYACTR